MNRGLLAGEESLRVTRQHWSVFVPAVALTIVVWVAGFIAIRAFPGTVLSRSTDSAKFLVGLLLVVAMLGVLLLRWLRWHYTTYVLTNRRIVVSRGILSRYTESITLDRVQDISTSQGLLGRMVRAGNVEIESAGRDGNEVLSRIADPVGFSNAVQYAVEAHRTGQPYPGSQQQGGWSGPPPQGYVPPGGTGGQAQYGPPPGYGQPPERGGGT